MTNDGSPLLDDARWFVKLLGRVHASGTTDQEPARGSASGSEAPISFL